MKCINCGNEVQDNWTTCPFCGNSLSNNITDSVPHPQFSQNITPVQNQTPPPNNQNNFTTSQPSNFNQGMPQPTKAKNSNLSIAAFALSFFGCFSLVGIILAIIDLVTKSKENPPKKHGFSIAALVIGGLMLIFSLLYSANKTTSDNKKDIQPTETTTVEEEDTQSIQPKETEPTQEAEPTPTEAPKPELDTSEALEIFNSGEYVYIDNKDLNTYASNLVGKKIYVVTNIDDMKDGMIQSTLSGGLMMSNFYVDDISVYEASLENGDIIAILGTVDNKEHGILGDSVKIKDCQVFAYGEEAEKYKKDATDESLADYLVITEDVAKSMNENEISKDDYIALCSKLDYKDILRNPDNNKDKYCKVTGKVDQVIEGFFGGFNIYVVDSNDNKWQVYYYYKDGESHVLEGDKVTVYGKCNGTTTSTTVLGKQVTLPDIDGKYIEQ